MPITISKFPCVRDKISDSELLDKASHPRLEWTRRWRSMKIVDIDLWNSTEIKLISLTQDIGRNQATSYNLRVREFVVVPGDALERTWNVEGEEKAHRCAPYAIADMQQAGNTIEAFACNRNNIETFTRHFIDKQDTLLWRTYVMAHHQSILAKVLLSLYEAMSIN